MGVQPAQRASAQTPPYGRVSFVFRLPERAHFQPSHPMGGEGEGSANSLLPDIPAFPAFELDSLRYGPHLQWLAEWFCAPDWENSGLGKTSTCVQSTHLSRAIALAPVAAGKRFGRRRLHLLPRSPVTSTTLQNGTHGYCSNKESQKNKKNDSAM